MMLTMNDSGSLIEIRDADMSDAKALADFEGEFNLPNHSESMYVSLFERGYRGRMLYSRNSTEESFQLRAAAVCRSSALDRSLTIDRFLYIRDQDAFALIARLLVEFSMETILPPVHPGVSLLDIHVSEYSVRLQELLKVAGAMYFRSCPGLVLDNGAECDAYVFRVAIK